MIVAAALEINQRGTEVVVDHRACRVVAVANVSYHIGDESITATENDKHQSLISYQNSEAVFVRELYPADF